MTHFSLRNGSVKIKISKMWHKKFKHDFTKYQQKSPISTLNLDSAKKRHENSAGTANGILWPTTAYTLKKHKLTDTRREQFYTFS
jgi:hypothetical protein